MPRRAGRAPALGRPLPMRWVALVGRVPLWLRWLTAVAVTLVGYVTGLGCGFWLLLSASPNSMGGPAPLGQCAAVTGLAVAAVCLGPASSRVLALGLRRRWLAVAVVAQAAPVVWLSAGSVAERLAFLL